MPRLVRTCVLLTAVALLAALLPAGAFAADAGGPQARAAKGCNIRGQQRSLGPTYVIRLSVRRTSCRGAKRVVRAYHRCRYRRGGRRGRCPRVSGYRCSERRSGIRTQFDARATCRRGGRRISHTYTQNT